MSDATDVSLETDRLEQLLETPAPGPPVVMIQYRDRGIPWWVFVPLLFVVPIVTILVYHHSVVERYRAQAAEATHFVETWAETAGNANRATTNPTGLAQVSPPEAGAAAGPKSTVAGSSEPATLAPAAAATASPVPAPDTVPDTSPAIEALKVLAGTAAGKTSGDSGNTMAGAGPTTAPASLEPAAALAGGDVPAAIAPSTSQKSEGSPKTDPDGIARNDPAPGPSGGPLPAGDQAPRSRVHSVFPSPFETETEPAASTGKSVNRVGPGGGSSVVVAPMPEPLPSKEELEQQIAEEARRKELDIAEERADRAAGIRAMRYDDRVKFHKELREIIEAHGRESGQEIDKLARRYSRDHSDSSYSRARAIWRHGRMSQQAKVNAIRSLDIPEAAILDFMSDNLYGRIRTPGGPRNENEVRMRAAQLLLSYQLPTAPTAEPGAAATGDPGPPAARTATPR